MLVCPIGHMWKSEGSLRAPYSVRVPETEVCLASLVAGACFYLLSHLATPTPTGGLLGAGSIITIAFCKLTVPTIDMTHSQ